MRRSFNKVQIHYIEEDGSTGVINYLTSENIELSGASSYNRAAHEKKLLDKAIKMVGEWSAVYPFTRFRVVTI